jgi:hypothetical protein
MIFMHVTAAMAIRTFVKIETKSKALLLPVMMISPPTDKSD